MNDDSPDLLAFIAGWLALVLIEVVLSYAARLLDLLAAATAW